MSLATLPSVLNSACLLGAPDEDARTPAAKLLAKWRPHVLQQEATNGLAEGVKAE